MKWERRFLVALAIFFILFFSVSRFMDYRERKIRNELREIPVTIEGIVRKPGTYYVPYGTTKFEVLKVAGVLPNSDLNDIDVYAQAESGESIKVGKLEQDVAMKPEGVVKQCQINYAVGDVTIRGAKGGRKAEKDGQLFEGDTVITGKSGSMELRLGDESLVDLRGESSMLIAALYKASGDGQLAVQFSLLKGGLWSFIKPQPANIKWKFFTAFLVSEIQGTEIEINHSAEQSVLLVKKGQVYAGRNGTEKRLSVMEGQKIVVPSDIAKDIAVSELTEEDRKGADKEMTSVLASGEAGSSSSVRRFIVMLVPYYYIVSEFNKQTGAVSVTRIIPTANVSEYVEGVNELGKVYLYGGIRLTISVIERMTRKRIERYAVLDRNGVFKTIDRIGGVTVELSAEDAENLGLKSGPNKLDSEKVLKYLQGKDKNSGLSLEKQDKLIRAMYAEISGSKLNATKALISQLTSGLETDIDVSYGTDLYDVIKSRKDWRVDIVSY